jgi:hypothetical protein
MHQAQRRLAALGGVLALGVLAACQTASDQAGPIATPQPASLAEASSDPGEAPLPEGLQPRPNLPPLQDGEVAACTDLCGDPPEFGRVTPGSMPPGPYQTTWFFGGYMMLELGAGWSSLEDSVTELHLFPPLEDEYGLHFGLDIHAVDDGERVAGVPNTAEAFIEWLRSNPKLSTTEPTAAEIAGLPAQWVDVSLAATAENEAADCPASVCVLFFGDDLLDHHNGIAGDDVYRFYLADVEYSDSEHVFSIVVEGRDREDLDSLAPVVEGLLTTVRVPASPLDR